MSEFARFSAPLLRGSTSQLLRIIFGASFDVASFPPTFPFAIVGSSACLHLLVFGLYLSLPFCRRPSEDPTELLELQPVLAAFR